MNKKIELHPQPEDENDKIIKILSYLKKRQKVFIYGVMIFFALIISFSLKYSKKNKNNINQYFLSLRDVSELESDDLTSREALTRLQKTLSKRSSLFSRFNGVVAKELSNLGESQESQVFYKRVMEKEPFNGLEFYQMLAQTSSFLNDKEYKKAKENSELLCGVLLKEKNYKDSALLYVSNLIYLKKIYNELGETEKEQAAINEIMSLLDKKELQEFASATKIDQLDLAGFYKNNYK